MHTTQDQDIEALVDNELPPAKKQRLNAHIRQSKSAQKRLETLEMQKLMLIYWFEMTGQSH